MSILLLLQLRGRVSAQALADEFEVSVRSIHRDIDELSASGVPITATRGPQGGFELQTGYQTKLTGIGGDEETAMRFVSLPSAATALGMGDAARAASLKVFAALPQGGARASRFAARFHVDPNPWYHADPRVPALPQIARAVLDQRVVSMQYESWRGTRAWRVKPLGLVLKAGAWYVVAETSRGKRTFLTAKMSMIQIHDESFTWPKAFDLAKHWQRELERFEASLRPLVAVVHMKQDELRRLIELGTFAADAAAAAKRSGDGWFRVALPIESIEHAARQLAGLGTQLRVESPVGLITQMRSNARQLAARHRGR
jgi:predicted DNA-binding transcriptional regulator YafY